MKKRKIARLLFVSIKKPSKLNPPVLPEEEFNKINIESLKALGLSEYFLMGNDVVESEESKLTSFNTDKRVHELANAVNIKLSQEFSEKLISIQNQVTKQIFNIINTIKGPNGRYTRLLFRF